jgi:NAD-dependent SIR2 family protein deacetylase
MHPSELEQAAKIIHSANHLLIVAGAGMSVDSGLPDFRGEQGFWKKYPVLQEEGISFYDMATPDWFISHPRRAWGFYGHRYLLYRNTQPHEGYALLKKWCSSKESHFIYTTNVDGHFQKAGFSGRNIFECHGSIHHAQCSDPYCISGIWPLPTLNLQIDQTTLTANGRLPNCRVCSVIALPNILMFNDSNWISARSDKQWIDFRQWETMNHLNQSVAIIEIGVGDSACSAQSDWRHLSDTIIRINPNCEISYPSVIGIPMRALDALQALDSKISSLCQSNN